MLVDAVTMKNDKHGLYATAWYDNILEYNLNIRKGSDNVVFYICIK